MVCAMLLALAGAAVVFVARHRLSVRRDPKPFDPAPQESRANPPP